MLQFWAEAADGSDLSPAGPPEALPSNDSAGTCINLDILQLYDTIINFI